MERQVHTPACRDGPGAEPGRTRVTHSTGQTASTFWQNVRRGERGALATNVTSISIGEAAGDGEARRGPRRRGGRSGWRRRPTRNVG